MRKRRKKKRSPVMRIMPQDGDSYITQLSTTRSIPKDMSDYASSVFFSKHGVIRVYDRNENLVIEVWVGSRRLRTGNGADIKNYMAEYYARQGVAPTPGLTDWQLFLGYSSALFSNLYKGLENEL